MTTRLAIINHDKCKPTKCNKECQRGCPVQQQDKQCIDIENVAIIYENMCIGCGQCVKRCPFGAINIVNVPTELNNSIFYMYYQNSFRLYHFPKPKIGKIYGIIGKNGIGKSTLLHLLSGKYKPNFGDYDHQYEIGDILKRFRGSELQTFFDKLYNRNLKTVIKHQNIENIKRNTLKRYPNLSVKSALERFKTDDKFYERVLEELELIAMVQNDNLKIKNLSGGEMQRLICATVFLKKADIYIFDEPTNYLDIKQRLAVGRLIKELSKFDNYIFLVEHDMSIMDYTADIISVMYGEPGAYGVVSLPYNTSEAINIFFKGYIPSQNMRFRKEAYNFNDIYLSDNNLLDIKLKLNTDRKELVYPSDEIKLGNFCLHIQGGNILSNVYTVLLVGQNGTGKTTFLNWLSKTCGLKISYKQQYTDITTFIRRNGKYLNVQSLLFNKIRKSMCSAMFISDVVKPLGIQKLYEKKVNILSGGELQRVMICLCLGTDADLYLIDEPSASLDIEQRIITTKILNRFFLHNRKLGFIVEHDMTMIVSLGIGAESQIIVFEEEININKRESTTSKPLIFSNGLNKFLKNLDVTFRKDNSIKRPRINKRNSVKDKEQRKIDKYFN